MSNKFLFELNANNNLSVCRFIVLGLTLMSLRFLWNLQDQEPVKCRKALFSGSVKCQCGGN